MGDCENHNTHPRIGELATRVNLLAAGNGKKKVQIWSRFSNHFRLGGYRELPADKYDEALAYLESKKDEYTKGAEMLFISAVELDALVNEKAKTVHGELVDGSNKQFQPDTALFNGNDLTKLFPADCRILATREGGITVKIELIPEKCLIHTIDEFRSLVEMEHVIIKKAQLKQSVTLDNLIQLLELRHCAENAQVTA